MKNLVLILFTVLSFSFTSNASQCNFNSCPFPTNIQVVAQSFSEVAFDWDDCNCTNPTYKVYYVKDGVRSNDFMVTSSSIAIENLSVGTYHFYFSTINNDGVESIIIEDVLDL